MRRVRILMLGDSILYCHGLARTDVLTRELERSLRARGYEVDLIARGYRMHKTADVLARFVKIMRNRPDIVIITGLGTNDSFAHVPVPDIEANLGQLITKFRAEGVAVLLAGMHVRHDFNVQAQLKYGWKIFIKRVVNAWSEYRNKPRTFPGQRSWKYATEFNGLHERVAAEHSVPLYPYLYHGIGWQMHDMLHANQKGVQAIAERMLPFVTKHLDNYLENNRQDSTHGSALLT